MFQKSKNRKLIKAAAAGDTERGVKLIASGADINARQDNGNLTALMAAISNERELFSIMLIEKDADVNAVSLYKDTALHWAAAKGMSTVLNALLDKGANIDARKKDGATALILAASAGYANLVKTLLNRGADFSITDHSGHTAYDAALAQGKTAIAKILKEAANGNIPQLQGWVRTSDNVTCRRTQLDEGVSLKEYVDFTNETYTTIVNQNGKISHTCQNFNEIARGTLVDAAEPLNAIEGPKRVKALPAPDKLI